LKTVVDAQTDDVGGHASAVRNANTYKTFGFQLLDMSFFPQNTMDFSSLGLKVATLNPDVFNTVGAGIEGDALETKAVYQAGYKGQIFASVWLTAAQFLAFAPPEACEGMISTAQPYDFDPPTTALGKAYKDAWVAKYGPKLEPANSAGDICYEILKTALQKVGSLDVDKVADAIGSGLRWEGAEGKGAMVPRLDLGNSRTVDSVMAWDMKIIKSGKMQYLDTIDLDKAIAYYNLIFKAP
jgi:ABC-type branched-subunit amino acid transport system substrate-binding protein